MAVGGLALGAAVAAEHGMDKGAVVDDVVGDVNTLSWLNTLLGSIFPKCNTALINYVHAELTPRLQEILPGPFKRAHFSKMSLGKKTPEFGPITVQRHSESHVQIELEMRYFSDIDVLVETGTAGISFGINQITFVGRLCIALKPLLKQRPVIGGVHFFFATQPRVELQFSGLAEAVNLVPQLKQKVHTAVDDFFRNCIVLPNMKSYNFTRDEGIVDLTQASSHPPLGVLRCRVRCARNLAGANLQLGMVDRFTSDPYCVLRLGHTVARTSTVSDSADPHWPATEPSSYFVVYHHEQELEISVMQEEGGLLRRNLIGGLGKMPAKSVRELLRRPRTKPEGPGSEQSRLQVILDTSQVNRGMLHVNDPVNMGVPSELEFELEWFNIAEVDSTASARPLRTKFTSTVNVPGGPIGVLLVELHSGTGFPQEVVVSKKGLRWQCRLFNTAGKVADREDDERTPNRSRRGEYHIEEPDYGLQLHPRLYSVIDQLTEYDLSIVDIADICDTEPEVVASYLQLRRESREQAEERRREAGEEQCVELRWHETLPLIVRQPMDMCLIVELVEGEAAVVGRFDPISMAQLVQRGGNMARTTFKLLPTEREVPKPGFLSSLLFPSCNKPEMAPRSRYRAVRMELSVRLQPLVPGGVPRTVGAATSLSSPAYGRGGSDQNGYPKAAAAVGAVERKGVQR